MAAGFWPAVWTWLLLLGLVSAVYEDEAYSVDWVRQQIGVVGQISGVISEGEGTFGALNLDLGFLGSIKLSDGELLWRRQVSGQYLSQLGLVDVGNYEQAPGYILAQHHSVEVYNGVKGSLESEIKTSEPVVAVWGHERQVLVGLEGSTVERYDGTSGQLIDSVKLPSGTVAVSGVAGTEHSEYSAFITTDRSHGLHYNRLVLNGDGQGNDLKSVAIKSIKFDSKSNYVYARQVPEDDTSIELLVFGKGSGTAHASPDVYRVDTTKGTVVSEPAGDFESVRKADSPIIAQFPFSFGNDLGAVIQLADGRLERVDLKGHVTWAREEGLSKTARAAFLGVPEPVSSLSKDELLFEEHANPLVAYARRVQRHLSELQHLPQYVRAKLATEETSSSANAERNAVFGFHKYVIAVTEYGRVVALDSTEGGKLVWGRSDAPQDVAELVVDGTTVYVVSTTGRVLKLDGLTGDAVGDFELQLNPGELVSGLADNLVVWTSDSRLLLLEQPAAAGVGGTEPGFYAKLDNNSVQGYSVDESGQSSATWTFVPENGGQIQALSVRDPKESASVGIILGNRSVLYKYLHPNSVAVASLTESGVLTVALVDTVSGKVLHSKSHDAGVVAESTQLLYGEYWLVYTFYGSKPTPSTQLVVWDLYESENPDERWTKTNGEYSSLEWFPPPHVKSQAFFMTGRVGGLGITTTKFGITSRDVIVSFTDGQLMIVPKKYIDARRPVGRDPTKEEAGEGLQKYDSVVVRSPLAILSHYRQVFAPHIVTTAASLESTSLVLAYGHDLFFTRVTPSHPFDVLSSGFSRTKLLLTIAALAAAVVVLKPMVNRKTLNQRWL